VVVTFAPVLLVSFISGLPSLVLSYRLHETVYECETDKRYGNSPLFGYNYSVLLGGDISVGDTVYIS